jgi:hypothetical protein
MKSIRFNLKIIKAYSLVNETNNQMKHSNTYIATD